MLSATRRSSRIITHFSALPLFRSTMAQRVLLSGGWLFGERSNARSPVGDRKDLIIFSTSITTRHCITRNRGLIGRTMHLSIGSLQEDCRHLSCISRFSAPHSHSYGRAPNSHVQSALHLPLL